MENQVTKKPDIEPEDLKELEKAICLLYQPTFTQAVINLLGSRIEEGIKKLPANDKIEKIVEAALYKAADAALWTMDNEKKEASNKTHKALAMVSGAIGGIFGFSALAAEIPVSTTIILRSIADIARSYGFDLSDPIIKNECIRVFSLGGPSKEDDGIDTAYFSTRVAAAQLANITSSQTSKIASEIIAKAVARYAPNIATKMAAQSVPIVGAFTGATINAMFTDYYQDLATGHFTILNLKKKYGEEIVQTEYYQTRDKLEKEGRIKAPLQNPPHLGNP